MTSYRWFRQSKFASFQRQLNIYGFTRINSGKHSLSPGIVYGLSKGMEFLPLLFSTCVWYQSPGPDKGGYYHELFLRGKQFLAEGIQRTKIKGMGPRKPAAGEIQPDFYALPPIEGNNIDNNSIINDTSSRPDEQSSAPPALVCASGLSGPASADLNVNLTSLLFSSLQVQQQQSQQQQQQQSQQRFLDHLSTLARSACAASTAVNTNASSIPNEMASHILNQTLVDLFERILAKDKIADGSTDPTSSHAAEAQFLGRD